MNHRLGMIALLALWALTVAPSTCSGGLLLHGCPDDGDATCAHESACPSDQCNVVALKSDTVKKRTDRAPADVIVPVGAAIFDLSLPTLRRDALAPPVILTPLPGGDLPLLC